MTLQSMTGFGAVTGQAGEVGWAWEVRSVNGRGLDIRMRLPEGAEALEPVLRAAVARKLSRGNVSLNLKLSHGVDNAVPALNPANLEAVIWAAIQARDVAEANGLELQPVSVGDLLARPWVWEADTPRDQGWLETAEGQIPTLVDKLAAARESEGQAIVAMLTSQIETAATLSKSARQTATERAARTGGMLREKVLSLLEITELADEERLAQELALIAVKADVTEELDRLDAHVIAARELLVGAGPVGRKFDFLMQEFNREANTLCSKSGSSDLTAIGLELKLVIDQMREQVQNLE